MSSPAMSGDMGQAALVGLVFAIIGNPVVYSGVQSVLGGIIPIADGMGCPTQAGVVIHALVAALLFWLLNKYVLKSGQGVTKS